MLADIVIHSGWSLAEILIAVVVLAAVITVVYIALKQFGVTIPPWAVNVFWVVVVAAVCIFAIRLLLTL